MNPANEPNVDEHRIALKRQWSTFITDLLENIGWTEADLGRAIGCSASCVSRWKNSDPIKGSIPTEVAARALRKFAEERGLL